MIHYPDAIRNFGSPNNYTSEADEQAHQFHAKAPFKRTNARNTTDQMAKYVTRSLFLQKNTLESDQKCPKENFKLCGERRKKVKVDSVQGLSESLQAYFDDQGVTIFGSLSDTKILIYNSVKLKTGQYAYCDFSPQQKKNLRPWW